jgi:hypothetical protein
MTRDQEIVVRVAALAGYAIAAPFLLPLFGAALIDALIAARNEVPRESKS